MVVDRVDRVRDPRGDLPELEPVGLDLAAGHVGEALQRAEPPARVRERGRGLVVEAGRVDHRRARRAERDRDAAVAVVGDRRLPELGEPVEQQVALVHQVVRDVARGDEPAHRVVEGDDLARDLLDLAAGRGERVELGAALRADERELLVDDGEGLAERARLLDQRLAGRLVLRRLGQVAPGVPEVRQLLVDAVVGRLGERQLGAVEALGPAGLLAQARGLGAVLEVEERVAHAAVGLDVDARADVRARAALDRAVGDLERRRGGHDGLLARVPLRRGVGDVVAGGVQRPLLGEQPAQGGLEAVEGGDRHRRYAFRSREWWREGPRRGRRRRRGRRPAGSRPRAPGRRAARGGRGTRAPGASARG